MLADALYLIALSTRNRLRVQLRRLRTPRYAIAALVGVLYFVFLFGGWSDGDDAAIGDAYLAAAHSLGPLVLALLAAWWWLWGGHRAGLVLTPAETHLLVPAPLPRRALVRFKILQAQVPILFSAGLGTLITRESALPWPLRLLSLWVLLATLHQHQIAASLVHAAAEEQHGRGLRRHRVPLLLFGAALAGIAWSVWRAAADVRAAGLGSAPERFAALMQEPVPRVVFAPFRLLLDPLGATSAAAWAPAFGGALVVLAVHYVWVQRTDAAFEESAAAEGERRARRAAAVQAGGFARLQFAEPDRPRHLARPWLRMAADGRPAYAIFWKNVLYVQRLIRPVTLALAVVGLALLVSPAALSAADAAAMLRSAGFALLVIAILITVAGPLAVRNDLRMDLRHIELLRTLPLRGRDVVTAGIAAAALVVSVLLLPFALGGLLLLTLSPALAPPAGAAAMLAAALGLPPIAALGVTVQNALALLYPGWTRVGGHDSGGIEAIGQTMLTMFGTLVLLGLALLPPLLCAALAAAAFTGLPGASAVAAAGLAGIVAIAAEVWLLTSWLGRLYDRTEPVDVGALSASG